MARQGHWINAAQRYSRAGACRAVRGFKLSALQASDPCSIFKVSSEGASIFLWALALHEAAGLLALVGSRVSLVGYAGPIGLLVYWSIGLLVYWSIGLLVGRSVGLLGPAFGCQPHAGLAWTWSTRGQFVQPSCAPWQG